VSIGLALLALSFAADGDRRPAAPVACWWRGPSWAASGWASSCPRSTWAPCAGWTRR
jgi:hypothetical protein